MVDGDHITMLDDPHTFGANIALPVEQHDATGCTINNASATWPDRNSCRVHDSLCARTYFFTSLIERQIKPFING